MLRTTKQGFTRAKRGGYTPKRRRKRQLSDSDEPSEQVEQLQPPENEKSNGAKRHQLRSETGPVDEVAPQLENSPTPDSRPPSGYDLDKLRYHIDLQDFGKGLQNAANAVFSTDRRSRYNQTSVLMLSWVDEDPDLPVSLEISALRDVFVNLYSFSVEEWQIPAVNSHMELNLKILQFLKDSSPKHLKIVYYAGHGKLSNHGQAIWTSCQNSQQDRCPTVKWSGIQNALEESESDVLILLDCCASGMSNTDEGNGVTELIAACAFNDSTNGVGRFSFTHALIGQLTKLVNMPSFTVGYLYNLLFAEIQGWRKEDTRHKKAPVHLVLTQDHRLPRSIKISSKTSSLGGRVLQTHEALSRDSSPWHDTVSGFQQESSRESTPGAENVISPFSSDAASSMTSISAIPEYPRLLFSIRISENIKPKELSTELFADWLGTLPIATKSVRVEAGFASDSTLLMVSMPVGLLRYLPENQAITMLGITRSVNLLTFTNDMTADCKISPVEKELPIAHQDEMQSDNLRAHCGFPKCGCCQFELDRTTGGNTCDCGHKEYYHSHVSWIETPEIEHLKEKISALRRVFDRNNLGERVFDGVLDTPEKIPDKYEADSDDGAWPIRSPPGKGKAIEPPVQEEFSGYGLTDKFEAFAKTPWSDEEDDSNIKIKVKKGCSQCEHSNENCQPGITHGVCQRCAQFCFGCDAVMTLKFWKADRLWEVDFIASRSTISRNAKTDSNESKIAIKQETAEAFEEDMLPRSQSTLDMTEPSNLDLYTQIFDFTRDLSRTEILFNNLSDLGQVLLQKLAHGLDFEYEYSVPTRTARVSRPIPSKGSSFYMSEDVQEFIGSLTQGNHLHESVGERSRPGHVSRGGSSCWTCIVSKKYCDCLIPICTSCSTDNKECVGYNTATRTQYGRSFYVEFLEARAKYLEGVLADSYTPYAIAGNYTYRDSAFSWSTAPQSMGPEATSSSATYSNVRPHPWVATNPVIISGVSSPGQFLDPWLYQSFKGCVPCEERGVVCDLEGLPGYHPCKMCVAESASCYFGSGNPISGTRYRPAGVTMAQYLKFCTPCKQRRVECSFARTPGNPPCRECFTAGFRCDFGPASDNTIRTMLGN